MMLLLGIQKLDFLNYDTLDVCVYVYVYVYVWKCKINNQHIILYFSLFFLFLVPYLYSSKLGFLPHL